MEASPMEVLPPELRVQIYELVLRHPIPIYLAQDPNDTIRRPAAAPDATFATYPALMLTCKLLSRESADVFYGNNSFLLFAHNPTAHDKSGFLRDFLRRIGRANSRALRTVTLDIGEYATTYSGLDSLKFLQVIKQLLPLARRLPKLDLKMSGTWPSPRMPDWWRVGSRSMNNYVGTFRVREYGEDIQAETAYLQQRHDGLVRRHAQQAATDRRHIGAICEALQQVLTDLEKQKVAEAEHQRTAEVVVID